METVAACQLVETVRQNLVLIMRDRSLSQTAVRELTDVPQSLLSRLISGVQDNLSAETIWKLSQGLNVEPRQLVDPDFGKILSAGLTAL